MDFLNQFRRILAESEDSECFEKHFSPHVPMLYKSAIRMCGNQFKQIIESNDIIRYGWEEDLTLRNFIDKEFKTDIFPPTKEVLNQLKKIGGINKALDLAMDAERIVGEFFRLLHNSCDDIEIKTLLTILEKAEHEHLERVRSFKSKF